jgi:hypothetical protein
VCFLDDITFFFIKSRNNRVSFLWENIAYIKENKEKVKNIQEIKIPPTKYSKSYSNMKAHIPKFQPK